MESFATLIGQYNSSALTLTNGDYGHPALDSSSRLVLDHSTSSMKIGNGGSKFLDILTEDSAYAGDENSLGMLAVRKDAVGTMVSADGDFTFLQVDAQGRLRVDAEISVSTGSDKVEDTAHQSGAVGCFNLAVANEALVDLCSDDGDYVGFAVDKKGRQYVISETKEQGTEFDVGVDEAGDGQVDVVFHATDFVDVATIAVGVGEVLKIKGLDCSSDKQIAARLVVKNDTTISKYIRVFPVTENTGLANFNWSRAIEVAGSATISVILQARCMRVGKTAHVGGGINAYK